MPKNLLRFVAILLIPALLTTDVCPFARLAGAPVTAFTGLTAQLANRPTVFASQALAAPLDVFTRSPSRGPAVYVFGIAGALVIGAAGLTSHFGLKPIELWFASHKLWLALTANIFGMASHQWKRRRPLYFRLGRVLSDMERENPEIVRRRLIEVIESNDGFKTIIAAIDIPVSMGYTDKDLVEGVTAFLNFLKDPQTVVRAGLGRTDAPVFEVWANNHRISYNPLLINELLLRPHSLFHEAMHFMQRQRERGRDLIDLIDQLRPSLDISNDAQTLTTANILLRSGFDPDSLRRHPEGIEIASHIVRIEWIDEIEAYFLTTAALAVVAASQGRDLNRYVKRLYSADPEFTPVDVSLTTLYHSGNVTAAFEDEILRVGAASDINLKLFTLLSRARDYPNFREPDFEEMADNSEWLAWARNNILRRNEGATSHLTWLELGTGLLSAVLMHGHGHYVEGYLVAVALHELGHGAAAWFMGYRVFPRINWHGIEWWLRMDSGQPERLEDSIVQRAGPWASRAGLAAAFIFGFSLTPFGLATLVFSLADRTLARFLSVIHRIPAALKWIGAGLLAAQVAAQGTLHALKEAPAISAGRSHMLQFTNNWLLEIGIGALLLSLVRWEWQKPLKIESLVEKFPKLVLYSAIALYGWFFPITDVIWRARLDPAHGWFPIYALMTALSYLFLKIGLTPGEGPSLWKLTREKGAPLGLNSWVWKIGLQGFVIMGINVMLFSWPIYNGWIGADDFALVQASSTSFAVLFRMIKSRRTGQTPYTPTWTEIIGSVGIFAGVALKYYTHPIPHAGKALMTLGFAMCLLSTSLFAWFNLKRTDVSEELRREEKIYRSVLNNFGALTSLIDYAIVAFGLALASLILTPLHVLTGPAFQWHPNMAPAAVIFLLTFLVINAAFGTPALGAPKTIPAIDTLACWILAWNALLGIMQPLTLQWVGVAVTFLSSFPAADPYFFKSARYQWRRFITWIAVPSRLGKWAMATALAIMLLPIASMRQMSFSQGISPAPSVNYPAWSMPRPPQAKTPITLDDRLRQAITDLGNAPFPPGGSIDVRGAERLHALFQNVEDLTNSPEGQAALDRLLKDSAYTRNLSGWVKQYLERLFHPVPHADVAPGKPHHRTLAAA